MAHLPPRHHGNCPQRRATLFPCVAKCRVQLAPEAGSPGTGSPETGSDPTAAAAAVEPDPPADQKQLCSSGSCEMENKSNPSCNGNTRAASPSSEKRRPGRDVAALVRRLRIPPEAQRILGNSCIPVVSLERFNFLSVSLSCLQPVVSLVRLPCQTQAGLHNEASGPDRPVQNGFSEHDKNILEQSEAAPQSDLSQPEPSPTSWTEPYCPDSPSSEEPEQDSGFDLDSNPDQPYLLLPCPNSGPDEWDQDGKTDSETFYLDPDSEQTLLIKVEPEPEADRADRPLKLEDEVETKWEMVQTDENESQKLDVCCSKEEVDEVDLTIDKPGPGPGAEEMESEDFCAVCLNGGDLLCCDRCPKVYHVACHIPPLISFPLGDWVCTLCRTDLDPLETYDCEDTHSCGGVKTPYTLSDQDQRRCEKLTMLLYCHTLSAPFHEPVSVLARNYYQIIKRPIDLSLIRRKLDKSNTLHYFSAEQFVDDVLLMFKNCATFNYPDSEVAQAGRSLEIFFLSKLKEIFPDQTFPLASQDRTDRARLRWLNRKRKENCKRRRYVFTGKHYFL